MNWIYVIQDSNGYAVSACYEVEKAVEICRSPCGIKDNLTYREIPFYKLEGTEINVIAGPIEKTYLTKP